MNKDGSWGIRGDSLSWKIWTEQIKWWNMEEIETDQEEELTLQELLSRNIKEDINCNKYKIDRNIP